jgi:prepilin-type N-terminal cleavage/methylation domain-containing protein
MKPSRSIRAFTLLEIMVVVAIIGIIFLMGIPAIRDSVHREALSQAIRDMAEACKEARARSILGSKPYELRIFPHSGRIEIGDVSSASAGDDAPPVSAADAKTGSGFSATLSDHLNIEGLYVNFFDFKGAEVARVHFYPNGTSDEFLMVLHSTDTGDVRQITLEAVTALADWGPFQPKTR